MSVKPKILILNTTGTGNKGDVAVLICHINNIKKLIPEARITVLSGEVETDKYYEQFGVEVKKHPWYRYRRSPLLTAMISMVLVLSSSIQKTFCSVAGNLNKNWEYPLSKYDVVLDVTADRLNQPACGFFECVYFLMITLLGIVLIGKPLILGPVSIGPLTSKTTVWLARYVLNKVDVITTREAITRDYLASIGVKRPRIELAADMAFLLESPASSEVDKIVNDFGSVPNGKPLVGIVVRMFVWERAEQYYQLMADVVSFIVLHLGAQVWLLPHDQGPHVYWKDKAVCEEIRSRVAQPQAVVVFPDALSPMEAKGILSRCDMVIAWKLHGTIAAASQGVPTLGISYGNKFIGILADMLNQGDNCIDLREIGRDQLCNVIRARIENIWKSRREISEELITRTKITREFAVSHVKIVKNVVDSAFNNSENSN